MVQGTQLLLNDAAGEVRKMPVSVHATIFKPKTATDNCDGFVFSINQPDTLLYGRFYSA